MYWFYLFFFPLSTLPTLRSSAYLFINCFVSVRHCSQDFSSSLAILPICLALHTPFSFLPSLRLLFTLSSSYVSSFFLQVAAGGLQGSWNTLRPWWSGEATLQRWTVPLKGNLRLLSRGWGDVSCSDVNYSSSCLFLSLVFFKKVPPSSCWSFISNFGFYIFLLFIGVSLASYVLLIAVLIYL